MQAIEECRTPALGGVVEWCGHCQYTHIQYRSCRGALWAGHCPKCQGLARARWLELFRATAQTLLGIARSRRFWPATPNAWAWNSAFSPSCIAGGGTCTSIRTCIASCLAAVCPRGRTGGFPAAAGKLQFFAELAGLSDPAAFARYLAPLKNSKWVVYAKAPFGGPQQVLDYLGRYTHRVAISNSRLRALEDGQVTFEWKDYRDGQTKSNGFLANCHRATRLEQCRRLLAAPTADLLPRAADYRDFYLQLTGINLRLCPQCGIGVPIRLALPGPLPQVVDTS